jgi:hypothetical protein
MEESRVDGNERNNHETIRRNDARSLRKERTTHHQKALYHPPSHSHAARSAHVHVSRPFSACQRNQKDKQRQTEARWQSCFAKKEIE